MSGCSGGECTCCFHWHPIWRCWQQQALARMHAHAALGQASGQPPVVSKSAGQCSCHLLAVPVQQDDACWHLPHPSMRLMTQHVPLPLAAGTWRVVTLRCTPTSARCPSRGSLATRHHHRRHRHHRHQTHRCHLHRPPVSGGLCVCATARGGLCVRYCQWRPVCVLLPVLSMQLKPCPAHVAAHSTHQPKLYPVVSATPRGSPSRSAS